MRIMHVSRVNTFTSVSLTLRGIHFSNLHRDRCIPSNAFHSYLARSEIACKMDLCRCEKFCNIHIYIYLSSLELLG